MLTHLVLSDKANRNPQYFLAYVRLPQTWATELVVRGGSPDPLNKTITDRDTIDITVHCTGLFITK